MIFMTNHVSNACFGLLSVVIMSCSSGAKKTSGKDTTGGNLADTATHQVKATAFKNFVPNELGKVMVLEYHLIGEPEDRWRRTPENLRKDFQMLYDNDFYPVSVLDLANGKLNVPAGKTPFAITFDDSSAGQFRFIEKNGKQEVDPNCAVGIMEDFKKKHPDFPLTASFYVLPAIKPNLRLFAQPEFKKEKLEWLLAHGYEIGNHNWFHVPLNKLDDAGVNKHLSMFVKEIQAFIPDYAVKSLALPLGMHAKNRALEAQGEFEGTKYKHEVVLLVGSATSVSPYSKDFDKLAVQRVQGGDTEYGPEAFIKQQIKHNTRFISDGKPDQITAPEKYKDQLKPGLDKKYKIVWVTDSTTLQTKIK